MTTATPSTTSPVIGATVPPTRTAPISTPRVRPAKIATIVILVFIGVVALAAITIRHNKKMAAKRAEKAQYDSLFNQWSRNAEKLSIYDLSKVSYGDSLVFEIKPGFSAKVELTNEAWCPAWSSGPIDTYDAKGQKRILDGNRFIQGPPTSNDNTYRKYENTGKNSITIKTGRCKSLSDCTIQF